MCTNCSELYGPHEALVISGLCKNQNRAGGGCAFVWPCFQKVQRLKLSVMTLEIESKGVVTKKGVPISCQGVAQVKISSKTDLLKNAAMHFSGKNQEEICRIILLTMEGHQRAIMGELTVESIYQGRQQFADQISDIAKPDMETIGIEIVSYTIKDLNDTVGYIKSLGVGRTSEVIREARVGTAIHYKDFVMDAAKAQQARMKSKLHNDTLIAKAKMNFDLKKAENDQVVETQKATADLARQLQQAKTQQEVKASEMQVKIIERSRQIEIQDQEILRREKELEAQIKKPADAMKYKLEVEAEATRHRMVVEAEAESESIRLKGEAEAFAINEKAKAEAEQMMKKASAWKLYQDAAMVDMVLETLPKVAEEIAYPLTKAKKITMVSTGGGEVGARKLTGEILDIVTRIPRVVEDLTGVKLN